MDITLEADSEVSFQIEKNSTVMSYVFEGEGEFGLDHNGGGEIVRAVRMVMFGDGDQIHIQTSASSHVRFFLMAGCPFNEPVVPYGPFVMNTAGRNPTGL